ncbi:chemotaxis protein CheW [Trichococcus sp. K1Tr]|uniref:chemotaxis protein CheW n=1 Tax=Trichococcus sp. K1Tr TaxID=3020847 RepID=UPI00232F5A49|nr:chemotaxis protein CheW [Trichococcus sp. K1Tr]MDB6353439.1 chemotaxis protein CheW [Trichococcus sp. K1Tr]
MKKFIVFICSQQQFAIPIEIIEKILPLGKLTLIPEASPYVSGVIQYAETTMPIIDLSKRLFDNDMEITENSKIIVVSDNELRFGIAVDSVVSVSEFDEELPTVNGNVENKVQYIEHLFKTDTDIIIHIDINALFHSDGMEELVALNG